jgi:hypothetical protein
MKDCQQRCHTRRRAAPLRHGGYEMEWSARMNARAARNSDQRESARSSPRSIAMLKIARAGVKLSNDRVAGATAVDELA